MDEGEWVRRIQEGETRYLTPLIERYYAGIQKYCYYRLRSEEESKDLTQETFTGSAGISQGIRIAGNAVLTYIRLPGTYVMTICGRECSFLPWSLMKLSPGKLSGRVFL